MKTNLAALAAGLTVLAAAGSASAADIDHVTGAVVTTCHTVSSTYQPTGQVFTVPAGETLMVSATMGIRAFPSTIGSTMRLYPITGTTLGAPIATITYSSTAVSPAYSLHTITLPGGGLPVTAGQTYAILASVGAGSDHCVPVQGPVYAGGSLYQTNNGPLVANQDAVFAVDFGAPPPPTIPTMSEWAMILFGLLLAGGAAVVIQRRRLA